MPVTMVTTYPDSLPPGPLKVVIPTKSVSSYLGDTALLECQVSGEPSPAIRWQKNREDLPVTFDSDSRLAMLPSGSLQVSRVQPPDSAMYRCLADNPGSSRTGADAELRVLPGNVGPVTLAAVGLALTLANASAPANAFTTKWSPGALQK